MKNVFLILLLVTTSFAKVDLTTLPNRDSVQLTIYNSADLTLARESRNLTLNEGLNRLQLSWANTLIDPTSLELLALGHHDAIDVMDLTFPPRVRELGLWNIDSEVAGNVPFEISYFTSGISWRAFYMGTLARDEKTMKLQGYVRISNNSGEDYENANVRMVVGEINLIDRIADLARREYAFGSAIGAINQTGIRLGGMGSGMMGGMAGGMNMGMDMSMGMGMALDEVKEVAKQTLSEYQLYTIEGTETIANGWSKRLPAFDPVDVPVVNLYKYEEQMYRNNVMRFLSFKNDKKHELGEQPLPEGMLKVYRNADEQKHLSYTGQSAFKYIPVNEKAELNLGAVRDIVVEPKLMGYKTANYRFDGHGNIKGWDEIRNFKFELKNTRDVPVKIEIKRNFDSSYWSIKNKGDYGKYEKIDHDTVKYTIELKANEKKEFGYELTSYKGSRMDEYIKISEK